MHFVASPLLLSVSLALVAAVHANPQNCGHGGPCKPNELCINHRCSRSCIGQDDNACVNTPVIGDTKCLDVDAAPIKKIDWKGKYCLSQGDNCCGFITDNFKVKGIYKLKNGMPPEFPDPCAGLYCETVVS